jgi:hypothetical protein
MKKKKQKEQPTTFQWDPTQVGDPNELPRIVDLESDARQGHIDEEQRRHLERRQAQTGRVLQGILGGKWGW